MRGWLQGWLPWAFIAGVAAGTALPLRAWLGLPPVAVESANAPHEADEVWQRSGAGARHAADVMRIIDGDTFEARIRLWPDLVMTARVRLRGIDAAEMAAACSEEYRLAAAAAEALRELLAEGGVTIFNVGPDKYAGRVVADAATRQTPNVSDALLATGLVRSYRGGRRQGWCAAAGR